jgi:hypothetical protein
MIAARMAARLIDSNRHMCADEPMTCRSRDRVDGGPVTVDYIREIICLALLLAC